MTETIKQQISILYLLQQLHKELQEFLPTTLQLQETVLTLQKAPCFMPETQLKLQQHQKLELRLHKTQHLHGLLTVNRLKLIKMILSHVVYELV